ncbi:PaaI family thioesterase [Nocardioides marmoriginsengisoli]|uniref:PaaI family thioesterase n=2 Tax=Nocardioides marmoriginsengisoli TaxID=661483 RepID=A0A3N0CC47_9ACTN|nr:PaaI family thioesterase [Nocardioides marmoriginsengisoli]
MTDEEFAREQAVYGGLTESLRRLGEVSLRTTVDQDTVLEAQRQIEEITARLSAEMIPANFGVVVTTSGHVRGYGNAVVGLRNPIAPPLKIVQDREKGGASSEFFLNALYEGPPGKVHGGVLALVLDQIFGEAAAAGGTPGMTGTLTLRYRKPTALGALTAEAWVDSAEGIKTVVKGWVKDADGETTVEAEGLFILPRWAREQLAASGEPPPQYE